MRQLRVAQKESSRAGEVMIGLSEENRSSGSLERALWSRSRACRMVGEPGCRVGQWSAGPAAFKSKAAAAEEIRQQALRGSDVVMDSGKLQITMKRP